uniref:ARAD1D33308p n=1 Tax=Blastobotrys adeninivorans TaxID=409370 RepID=A0A060THQ9_BLAAD
MEILDSQDSLCVFRRGESRTPGVQFLQISKPNGQVSVATATEKLSPASPPRVVEGVVGIISLRITRYVIVITKAHSVGALRGHDVRQADKFDLIPLRDWKVKDETEAQYLKILRDHLQSQIGNIFFSPTTDLTLSAQMNYKLSQEKNGLSEDVITRFLWNYHAAKDILPVANSAPFLLRIIHGVVSLHQTSFCEQPIYFGLITRRSRFRAGTRYFRRGIDGEGHVANFNETEQILELPNGKKFSFVQTRGSVPTYWGEVNDLRYKPKLQVGKRSSVEAARRHFDEQVHLYGKNYLVNLVNQSGYEKPVKMSYEDVVAALNDSNLEYVYFDFHHECSKMRWHRVDLLIDQLEGLGLDSQEWFELSPDSNVSRTQTSVVRTNCMDCLDRTNVVQSKLGRWVLQRQFQAGEVAQGPDPAFEKLFQNTWADNADGVSKAYSGTGALKTDFTRLGKRTKLGALSDLRNSITRYVKNNFCDGPRQDGYDLFLGNYHAWDSVQSPFFDGRPILTQSLPYVMLVSAVMVFAAIFFPKEDQSVLVNRLFIGTWACIFGISTKQLLKKGMDFVNWPRLLPVDYVVQAKDGSSIIERVDSKMQ